MTEPAVPRRGPSTTAILVTVGIAVATLVLGLVLGPPLSGWLAARSEAAADASGTWYISQMHPWIVQPGPGQCPICGMDLTPVDPERFAGEITIDPVVVQNMGIRLEPARSQVLERSVGTVGVVALDQRQVHDVFLRVGGWVEHLTADALWDPVMPGQTLFELYSPELLAAQQEYLVAVRGGADSAVARAARARLELLGAPEDLIARLEAGGEALRRVPITSSVGGVVVEKGINEGARVQPQTLALRIADLSRVWVEVTVYEDQLAFIEQGQPVRIVLPYGDGHAVEGTVEQVYPVVDPRTRETTVRVVLDNPEFALRPGMYVRVAFLGRTPEPVVVVPRSAVVGTGDRRVAFVSLGRGRFEPREVVLGHQGDEGLVAVRSGIEAGEPVVVSGQFLLDSESRMREALAKFMYGGLAAEVAPPAVEQADVELPPAVVPALETVIDRYLALQGRLYEGDPVATTTAADALRAAVAALGDAARAADEHLHHRVDALAALLDQTAAPAEPGLPGLRRWFGALSLPLDTLLKRVGAPPAYADLTGLRCGMAEGIPDDGVWLQLGGDARNPYFGAGSGMRACASDSWGLPVAGAAAAPAASAVEPPPPETAAAASADAPPAVPGAAAIELALALHEALYVDDLAAAAPLATELATALEATTGWDEIASTLMAIGEADDLATARRHYGALGVGLRAALGQGLAAPADLVVMRCGMYRDAPDRGVWLQRGETVRNPFFGHQAGMAGCAAETWAVTAGGLEARE